jgi:guanylate cyclase
MSVVLAGVLGLVFIQLVKGMDDLFETVVILLKRLPPPAIVANPELLDYLMLRNVKSDDAGMTPAESFINASSVGVLSICREQTVDYMNQAVTAMLGYSPEQLLGQSVTICFTNEARQAFTQRIAEMNAPEGPKSWEAEMLLQTYDVKRDLLCKVVVFTLDHERNGSIYVMTIEDISKCVERKEAAARERKKSEDLWCEILPRKIVEKLGESDADIAFQVPCASVMFVNIVRFTQDSGRIGAPQTMGILSDLFGSFDKVLKEFECLTKIKIYGDTYMCASGLFPAAEQQQQDVEDVVTFAMRCLEVLDDINLKKSLTLQIRIGIHTGSVIACVLGAKKLNFDIFGDVINFADRLQRTTEPNTVQVSAETYNLARQMGLTFQATRNVRLKGKSGEVVTYIVRDGHNT